MCRHHSINSPKVYSIHDNLVNWFAVAIMALIVNWMSRQPETHDDYTLTWVSGAMFGFLFMWSLEIGREWLKTWRLS